MALRDPNLRTLQEIIVTWVRKICEVCKAESVLCPRHNGVTSALDASEWLINSPTKIFGTHRIPSLMGPRASLDVWEKEKVFSPYRDSNPRPSTAHSTRYIDYTTVAVTEYISFNQYTPFI